MLGYIVSGMINTKNYSLLQIADEKIYIAYIYLMGVMYRLNL